METAYKVQKTNNQNDKRKQEHLEKIKKLIDKCVHA